MNTFVELSNVAVETLLLCYFMNRAYAPVDSERKRRLLLFVLYGCILALLSVFPIPAMIRGGYSLISIVLIAKFGYDSKILNGIYATLAFNLLAIVADILSIVLLNRLGIQTSQLDHGGSSRAVCIVVAKLIVLVLIQISTQIIRKNDSIIPRWTIPLVVGQLFSIFAEALLLQLSIYENISAFYIAIYSACLLYINLVICFYTETIKTAYNERHMRELAEQQLQIQVSYYEKEQQARDATRALWHDIKKYTNATQDLFQHGDMENAVQSLQQATTALSEIHQTVDVGNAVVNGILERALEQVQNKGISLDFDVWVSDQLPINAVDLYIIMGNTIDNAIEACLQVPAVDSPTISLTLRQQNHTLFYAIDNPIPAKQGKKPGDVHGYGIRNVKNCVAKYHGMTTVSKQDGVFSVQIQLPLRQPGYSAAQQFPTWHYH